MSAVQPGTSENKKPCTENEIVSIKNEFAQLQEEMGEVKKKLQNLSNLSLPTSNMSQGVSNCSTTPLKATSDPQMTVAAVEVTDVNNSNDDISIVSVEEGVDDFQDAQEIHPTIIENSKNSNILTYQL